MKKLTALLLALLLCTLSLAACFGDPAPKTFTKAGMTITLTDSFRETAVEGYTVAYDSANIAVFALEEKFSAMEGLADKTLGEYGELVIANNGYSDITVKTENGLTFFEYDFENTQNGKTYHYYTYLFKTADAFWMVQLACFTSEIATYGASIAEYAKSITFA